MLIVAFAQSAVANDSIPITLKDAVNYALTHHPYARVDQLLRERAKWGVTEARGAFYPTLDVGGEARRNKVYGGNSLEVDIGGETAVVEQLVPRYQSNLGFELALNLYAGGANAARVDGAHAEQRATNAMMLALRGDQFLQLAGVYAALDKAFRQAARAKEALNLAQSQSTWADTERRAGRMSDLDREMRALELAEAEQRQITADIELTSQWQTYLTSIGAEPNRPVPAMLPLRPVSEADLGDEMLPQEAASPASVEGARAEYDVARATAAEAQGAFYPKVDMFVRYGYGSRRGDERSDSYYVYRDERAVGLRLSWNWFSGFQSLARYRMDHLEAESRRAEWEQRQRDWASAMRKMEHDVARHEATLALATRRLTLARMQVRRHPDPGARKLTPADELQYRTQRLQLAQAEDEHAAAQMELGLARLALRVENIAGSASAGQMSLTNQLRDRLGQ
jgi:outer membrane protein TolC